MLNKNINTLGTPITDQGTFREITFDTHKLAITYCKHANLDPDIIWQELGRVIWFMLDNCQNPQILGKLKDNYAESLPKHILDITTSPNWQFKQKMKEDIERCKVKC